jgi:hypothetical protein
MSDGYGHEVKGLIKPSTFDLCLCSHHSTGGWTVSHYECVALPEAEWVCNGHRRGRKMRKEDEEGR